MKVPLWAHLLHFGISASAVLAVAGGFIPGPIGVIVAATAGPVKNYLSRIATRTGE